MELTDCTAYDDIFSFSLRLFAGFVPRVGWISVGGFVFLGTYEKVSHTLNLCLLH